MLETLRELSDPSFTDWYPNTLGWKILAVLFAIWISYKAYQGYKLWRKNKYRRVALAGLKSMDLNQPYIAAQLLSVTLKATANYALRDKAIFTDRSAELCRILNGAYDSELFQQHSFQKNRFEEQSFQLWQQRILLPEHIALFDHQEVEILYKQVEQWIKKHNSVELL